LDVERGRSASNSTYPSDYQCRDASDEEKREQRQIHKRALNDRHGGLSEVLLYLRK
jgi:hypothetical protein